MRTGRRPASRPTLLPVLNALPLIENPRSGAGLLPVGTRCGPWQSSSEWLLWQLADSAFPTGGFAHSGGLEAAWQQGEIEGRRGLQEYLEASLHQAGTASVPWVTTAHAHPERLAELDLWCDAWLSNHVANRASRQQGRAFWTAVVCAFPGVTPDGGGKETRGTPEPGHLAPVFGMILARLGVETGLAVSLFLFQHLRSLLSASVRLGIVGPLEAQALQHRLAPLGQEIAWNRRAATLDDLAQTAPLLDLWQGAQDRLYSRLFQS